MKALHPAHELKIEEDLRYFLFNRYLCIIGGLAIVFMIIHIVNGRPFVNIITAALIAILCTVWYILSKYKSKYRIARLSFLIFMTVVYVPFSYWTSPGSTSAMMYMVILAVFMLSFMAVNKYEYIFAIIVVVEALIMLQTELWFPEHYYVYTDANYRIKDLSINFLAVAAAIVATSYYVMRKNSNHSDALYKASITDSLTGLYNRRYFSDFILSEFNKVSRYQQHFSIVLLDLNNFKRINDVYSHMEGDKVLKDIAAIISKNIRNCDVAARYGGDEYIIVLPNTSKDSAEAFAYRLEKDFEQYGDKYKDVNFSVAFGIEDSCNKSLDDVYRVADEQLYKKKMEQKNLNRINEKASSIL